MKKHTIILFMSFEFVNLRKYGPKIVSKYVVCKGK
jgi:hypothetical protein